MAFNPYGAPGNPYGLPPSFSAFPGSSGAPGMAPPPGLGMSSAPGLAPPPGVQQANSATQANRPSGLSASFQPPPNLPNINFNAPVIRLGASGLPPKPSAAAAAAATAPGPGRRESDAPPSAGGNRPGVGAERNIEQSRAAVRESMQALQPPTQEERLRTIFLHKVPASLGGDEGIEKFLNLVGRLRRWDSAKSNLTDHKGETFGFAQYDDTESLSVAVELLKDIELPVNKQEPTDGPIPDSDGEGDGDGDGHGIDKAKLQVAVDESTIKYLETWEENLTDNSGKQERMEAARASLKQAVRNLFYPRLLKAEDGEGGTTMGDGTNANGENVEVINIPLAQEDELADIPAEMREVVAQEIAAFRERSNRRDLERLRREEEMEEMERRRNGARPSRLDSPSPGANSIPLGPRGVLNAPSGPRGAGGRGVAFVNGVNGDMRDGEDTDASDEELHQRELSRQKAEDDKLYLEAERKWVNRERQRAAALERETDREKAEDDGLARRKEEQFEREKNWDDEKEASRKSHPYYRDRAGWARKRAQDRGEEEGRDEADRRAEESQRRREAAEMEQARDMADSFLNQQAQEMEQRQAATAAAPARFTLSLGAAAQKAQARSGPQRRTMAEVEGLLDDEEQEQTTKRQLVPIKFEPIADAKAMTEEEIQNAVKSLAQEIPATQDGLWAWDVKWDYLEDSIITEKLRPFIEKKVVEYLGVQEQLLVDVVEEHLRKHAQPAELAEELEGPLEDDAVDLVKKLWRMVIFFTESEKRGLPA
ncbi:hypothetical protein M406DRAFT_80617 [Cryphonectria parasitica EP155]|uniref:PWI domain-containing protein n=1 Tax=Cryphonectria parasitica (strain ATCC 38755 / EP155) TaxID=660469 RepID=A0A9P4Y8R4_CRYP1|nr:uncharacterized protein M406DRAFT_80617 [Cryphonectria parasitica EP155]KAF3768135.1 hypothetical protein M406DRAFT_80617 [Cryphonectria parasitica EP155]